MSKIKFKLNRAGVRELLRSPEVGEVVAEEARSRANRLPAGYSVNLYTGQNRVNAEIHADTRKAWKDNLKNNTLEKVIR